MIEEVDRKCRERSVFMIGPERARRMVELLRQKKPEHVLECGTALGYSGLWIASELKAMGNGRLTTIELEPEIAREASEHFEKADLSDVIEIKTGDAREVVKELEGPFDFLFLDCDFPNYYPCFTGIEDRLADGAIIVADNVGIGAEEMADYLDLIRSRYESSTEWFDLDLPWEKRDAMEITIFKT